jgi:membrane-bound lytic murein transglycosylase B
MGGCQFMPSTYHAHAADGDGDGKRDIWTSTPDVFASIASYLQSLGWDNQQEWGRAINVPAHATPAMMNIKKGHPASYWRAEGFTYVSGARIPSSPTMLYAIYAGSEADGAYLVSENFKALLNWNRSRYFATAVGTLADAIGE